MIQIIACQCIKQKFSEAGVAYYTKQKFYLEIKVFVAPCSRRPLFKDKFRYVQIDTSCKFMEQERGTCNNCKVKCFNLNFTANKIKVLPEPLPNNVQIKMFSWLFCLPDL